MKMNFKRFLSFLLAFVMVFGLLPTTAFATGAETNEVDGSEVSAVATEAVAKVGNTEYATINDAIANWTNGTTLTLLADVTLSDVVTLKSTEHHILDLGTYTMTAASGKNAIVIQACGTGSAERTAITINADATNPGGINAGSKSVVYYKYADGGISTEDRPIIKINGGVFTGSTSSWGTAGIYTIGTAARKCATLNITGGTFNCTINGSGKSKLIVSGGTFNYSVGSQGDSTALRLISGGKFKTLGFMTADSNNTKFWFGTSMGNSNVGLYVDNDGYLVVGGPVITEVSAQYPAVASNATKWSSYLAYSAAATYGLFYEDAAMAIKKHGEANVTVWVKPPVTIPENVTGDAAVVDEIKNNTALKDYTPENLPEEAELEIELVSVGETIVYDVTPMANGAEVEPTEAITFRLPVPASVTGTYAAVYHEDELMGIYDIKGEGDAKYVEVSSENFSEFAVKSVSDDTVAMIDYQEYETPSDAINAAQDGDTVVILPGEYSAINISNKNITIAGTVGDNGDLLTTIKGGNPAITGHGFNGTIKDLKIVDAWKVMYAEPAGNVTVDNVYVTGATYGLHLVAYAEGLTWKIQNSYMDLSWANSFGVYGSGDAEIIIKGNEFASINPYYPDYGALAVNTFMPGLKVEDNIFGEGAKIKIDASVTDTSRIEIATNYYFDGYDKAFADDSGVTVDITTYYDALNGDGTINKDSIKETPRGNNFVGYIGTAGLWGEVWGNATESFVIKALDANGNVMGTTSLNNIDGIIDGDVNVTWHLKFDAASNTDEYWTMSWITVPTLDNMPAKVELWVDGVKVSGGNVQMNGPDGLNKIVALVQNANGVVVAATTLADAVAAAQAAGDEIVLLADVTLAEDLTLPAGVIFNGNGKQVNGNLVAGGNLTFKGHTKVVNFNAGYDKPVITIGEGACLELTGSGRMVIGHGATFNITGTIADAKNANIAEVTPSLIAAGASFTGAGVNFNVTNAYVKFTAYCSSKNSSANGTFNFNINNSIWDQSGSFVFTEPTSGKDPTFNLNLKDSVLNSTSHLVFAVTKGEIVFDNSNVNVGTSRQIENRSTLTIKNGSVVYASVQTSSNAKNPGTTIVDNATYVTTGEFTGSDVGTGTLIIKKGANVTMGKITKANIVIDAADMTAGELAGFTANLSGLAGELSVINNDKLEAKIVDGKIVLSVKPVAEIDGVKYTTLEAAFKAATEGCTIEILRDVTVDYKWDCRDYATNGSHSQFKESVTINGNGHTIKFTGTISDGNWNTVFRFEENATVQNLTIDISEATGAQRVITAKKSLTVDGLTIIGAAKYGIIFGEGSSATDLAAAEIEIKNSTLTGTRRAISDNEGGKDVKAVTITGNTLNANVYVSASESIVFNSNTAAGEVDLRSYAAENVLDVEAQGNTLNEGKKNYIEAKDIVAQGEFATKKSVTTKAELNAALAAAKEGDTVVLGADIDYGTDQLAITKAITLDLGGHTLTTRNAYGGMSIKNNPTIKNGTIVHASNTAAIKVWNATAFENLVIDVQGKGDANKTIGGIVLQSGSTTRVGSIKNVTIKGVALTNGIETYNCGDATENVIGSMDMVTIDANGTGLLISAPCGTATNCSISGGKTGIELWIKGNYSASLSLEDSKVEGGVNVHDEDNNNPGVVNNGTLTLTVDEATEGVEAEDVTLTLKHVEENQVVGEVLQDVIENAQAKVNGTYYATFEMAVAAAQAGETVVMLSDAVLTAPITVAKSITIDGNGFNMIPADGTQTYNWAIMAGDSGWGDDHGESITLKNVKFVGWNTNYGVVRAQGVTLNVENCEFSKSSVSNDAYGVLSLNFTDATVTGSKFVENTSRAIDINFNGDDSNAVVTIDGCNFEKNTSNGAGIVVRNDGDQLIVKNSQFLNNTVSTNGNAATLYAGWGASDQVTGCTFEGNTVITSHASTKRFASAIFADGCTITENIFGENTATRNGESITTTVAVGAYYGSANISSNYWIDGTAPVPGVDYTVEYSRNQVKVEDYYADAEKSEKVELSYVAKDSKYGYLNLADAFASAKDGDTLTLLADIELTSTIKNTKKITLDLNGKTITGKDNNTSGNFYLIDNRSELTVTGNGTITLIAATDRDWNASSVVIANNPGGKLVVENGTIKHLGGTDMAYAIDNLTNGKGTYAETVINGGTIVSPYRAVRQFLNGVEAQNILTINGGTIEGGNKSIFFHDPSKNANTGTLTVGENASLKGDVYLFVTAGSTAWPVEVTIASAALAEGSTVVTGNVPTGYELVEVNGTYGVKNGAAKIGYNYYATLAEAFAAAQNGDTIVLLNDLTVDTETFTIADGVSITLDMNGKKITGTDNKTTSYEMFYIYGELTVTGNGTIELAATVNRYWNAYSSIFHNRGGVLTIVNGSFAHLGGTDMAYVVDNSGNYFGDATTNVKDGTLTSTYTAIRNRMEQNTHGASGKAILNISGGTINGTTSAVWAQAASTSTTAPATGEINVTGGNVGLINTARSNGAVCMTTISGGTVEAFKGEVGELVVKDNGVITGTVTLLTAEGSDVIHAVKPDGTYVSATATIEGKGGFHSVAAAVEAATPGETIVVVADETLAESMTIKASMARTAATGIILDLNGKTITGTDNATGSFGLINIQPGAELIITDSVGGGKITLVSTNNRGWNAYSAVISNQRGKLTVNGGIIEHLGGTDMAYAIDNLTNGKGTYAETIINGGTVKSTYRAIRQFLNGVEAQNILTINGGTIEGANKSIFFHDPSTNANSGSLTVGENATLNGDVYLFVTAGSTAWPVEVSIAGEALAEDSTVVTGNVPYGYIVESNNGDWGVRTANYVAKIGNVGYESLTEAFNAVQAGQTITVFEGTYALPSMKAGITVIGEGNVLFEGTLTGTLENLTLKNVHIKGGNAQRWAYAKGDLVFENVTFHATGIYALHFDGITEGATLTYKDCTIIGWAAMSGSPASCVFDGCTFEGNGTYGLIRTYFNAEIKNCIFDVDNVNTEDNYQDGIHSVGATVTVTGCTNVNGEMEDIVHTSTNEKAAYVVVDGETFHTHKWVEGVTVAPTHGVQGYTVYTCPCGEIKHDDITAALTSAKIGNVEYATLAEAVAAAKAGATINLVADVTGPGVVINKNLTIDFRNFTYTLTEPVGSAGTESNGFQILAGNTVRLQGGTLRVAESASDKFYILIQNYANLTVYNMTLDGTNLDKYASTDGDSYTLSNNSGNVSVNKSTVIANNDGDLAFALDACDKTAWGYDLPVVTVYPSSVIDGAIEAAAKVGNSYYATLADTVENAVAGKTITLMGNISGAGVVIDKNIIINFNGYTYTLTEGVGSTGTETNGFQILKGNTVTLENGTLKVADSAAEKFYILIQNYANLTVNNMTLDGTNLDKYAFTDGDSYTLSNNSGNVKVKNSTIIANDEGNLAFAFDVCDQTSKGYELPVVTVTDTTVTGNIEAAARIGNVYYATLNQAIEAAGNGKTITLVNDIKVDWSDVVKTSEGYNVLFKVEGKSLTLDLNGKTISVDHQSTTDRIYAVVCVGDGASLTVKGEGGIDVKTDANTPKVAYMFWKRGTTGTLTIENGTYHMNNSEDSMVYTNGNRIVTVKGGTWTLDAVGTRTNGFPCILNGQGNNTRKIVVTGGTFNSNINEQYWIFETEIEDGKGNLGVIVDNGNGTWTVTGETAEVGIVIKVVDGYRRLLGYATFKDAVASIAKGAPETTIVLRKDITVKGQFIGHSYAQNVIIDLNGYKMSSTDKTLTVYRAGTVVTIKNGTVHGNTTGGTIQTTYGGKLILGENVTVTSGSSANALKVDANSTLIIADETAVVKGGKADLVVADGANVQISAGYFKYPVKAEWCAENYIPTEKLANSYYSVMLHPATGMAAQIGNSEDYRENQYFETLMDAINAAENGQTITLISDLNLTTANTVTVTDGYAVLFAVKEKAITIDLNGKNIVVNASADELADEVGSMLMSVFCADTNGALTLTGEGSVTVNANGDNVYSLAAVYGVGGSLVINGGSYTADMVSASGSLIYAQYNEVITVNGGTFILGNEGTGANGSPWVFNAKGQNTAHIVVNGGSFCTDIQHQYWAFEVQVPKELALSKGEDGLYTVGPAAAYVNEQKWFSKWYTNYVGYATIEEATAALKPVRTKTVGKNSYTSEPEFVTILNAENAEETVKVETNEVTTLDEALLSGGNVTMTEDMTFSAGTTTANSGYGATGVKVNGGSFNGNGNTLNVTNAGDTWGCAVNATSGVIQNVTIKGAFRGIFMGGANGDVYINNVVIDGCVYTFNSDAGNKAYGVYITGSTLKGWTSFSNVHKEVIFTDCTFGEGRGNAFCRPYNACVFENCVFEEGFEFDTSKTSDIVFKNCYYGETLITAENAATLGYGETVFFYNGLNGITIE